MQKPSESNIKNYLDKPNHCPACQSKNISGEGPIEADGNDAWQSVRCMDCKFEWRDVYTITNIEFP